MALPTSGALPISAPTAISTDPTASAEYVAALNDQLRALESRQNGPNLARMAAGFLKPTRGGSFGESLGNANEEVAKSQELEEARALPIAQMRAQLAGQKYQMTQEAGGQKLIADALGGKSLSDISKQFSTPAGAISDPSLMNRLMEAQMQVAPGTKAAEKIKTLIDSQAKMIDIGLKTGDLTDKQVNTFFNTGVRQGGVSNTGIPMANQSGASTPAERAIVSTESGGDPNAVSPKGAMGAWQVMPNTQLDPGFGVTPAANNSPEELNRVGKDYYNAMLSTYKSPTLAAIAYNWGPGNTDKWLESGAQPNKLPQETRDYLVNVGVRTATNERMPSQETAPVQNSQLTPKAQSELALTTAQKRIEADLVQESEFNRSQGVAGSKAVDTMRTSAESADDIIRLSKNQIELTKSNPKAFGYLNDPSMSSALLAAANSARVSGVEMTPDRIAQYIKGVREPEDLNALALYYNNANQINLAFAKMFLQGQGAVSDNERKIVNVIGGLPSDSVEAIRLKADALKTRAQKDIDIHRAWVDFHDASPRSSYDKFIVSKEYRGIKSQYNDIFDKMRKDTSELIKNNTTPKKAGSLENQLNNLTGG